MSPKTGVWPQTRADGSGLDFGFWMSKSSWTGGQNCLKPVLDEFWTIIDGLNWSKPGHWRNDPKCLKPAL